MRLIELIVLCDAGYTQDFPESSLLEYINPRSGGPLLKLPSPIGDTLALFVVRELSETFDPDASDEEQLSEAIRVMAAARNNLDNIVSALEERRLGGIVEAASNVLGYDVDEDRVREALDEYGDTPLKALKKALKEREKTFKDQGGRGVDLADEIDSLRIAIAVRNAK